MFISLSGGGLPGKAILFVNTSKNVHPSDHISDDSEQTTLLLNLSGAL